jgi:hypothetical protein
VFGRGYWGAGYWGDEYWGPAVTEGGGPPPAAGGGAPYAVDPRGLPLRPIYGDESEVLAAIALEDPIDEPLLMAIAFALTS